jgi:hypothetical protein
MFHYSGLIGINCYFFILCLLTKLFVLQMPEVLAALQRSVHGVLLGKIARPDWVTHGVQRASRIDTFHIKLPGHGK